MRVTVNMDKAVEIKKQMIRAERKPLLEALDVAFLKALELGDPEQISEIKAKKQALRDATSDPVIVAARTPEELKVARPSALDT